MIVNSKNKNIKKIPYGIADYELIQTENYYYVDKTMYLVALRDIGRYLFFIRPRRFGKSLLISMMECYYDISYKERFEELFKGTWIYDHPTDDRGSYLVLKFNFSMVNPGLDNIEDSFLKHVKEISIAFIDKNRNRLESPSREYFEKSIRAGENAPDILSTLIRLSKSAGQKLYVLIDEYDNFANTILSTSGTDAYAKLTHGGGTFRAFFNVLKGGTSESGAPVARSLIIGVSPITMDDVTSGYNIGKNISIEHHFNCMAGFTQEEVIEMFDYYRSTGSIDLTTVEILEIMNRWYGNYRFSQKDITTLFNSDMVLYLLDNYLSGEELPDDLIDRNVRTDYRKLRHLIVTDKGDLKIPSTNGNFSKLKQIIADGSTTAQIVKGFPLEELTEPENFKSLLFYLGLLTIIGTEKDRLRLAIPNETVRHLYYDYIENAYKETNVFDLDLSVYADLMTDMAYDGKWQPLFEFITGRMGESMSLRDLITGEKSIQAFLNVYLGLSNLYIIHTEKELNKGFVDIVMEPFTVRYEGIKYSYLLEIKYTPTGMKPTDTKIERFKSEARKQLNSYSMDNRFKKNMEKTTIIKIILIFSGHKAVYIGQ